MQYTCHLCSRKFKRSTVLQNHYKACKTKPEISFLVDDDNKLYSKWLNKRNNAKQEGLTCELTYEEFCILAHKAGIKSSQIGFHSDAKYVLSRFNDIGNYTIDNCRFITQRQNWEEKHKSDAERTNWHQAELKISKEELGARISTGLKNSTKFQESVKNRKSKNALINLDQRYTKEHNSQFGTFWITNGVQNMKWHDTRGVIPTGFQRGRTVSKR